MKTNILLLLLAIASHFQQEAIMIHPLPNKCHNALSRLQFQNKGVVRRSMRFEYQERPRYYYGGYGFLKHPPCWAAWEQAQSSCGPTGAFATGISSTHGFCEPIHRKGFRASLRSNRAEPFPVSRLRFADPDLPLAWSFMLTRSFISVIRKAQQSRRFFSASKTAIPIPNRATLRMKMARSTISSGRQDRWTGPL